MLLECHRVQSSVLHKYSLALARTNDELAREYASKGTKVNMYNQDLSVKHILGDFGSSCRYLELSCDSVGAVYGKQSIEYGNELQKLASVMFHRLACKHISHASII